MPALTVFSFRARSHCLFFVSHAPIPVGYGSDEKTRWPTQMSGRSRARRLRGTAPRGVSAKVAKSCTNKDHYQSVPAAHQRADCGALPLAIFRLRRGERVRERGRVRERVYGRNMSRRNMSCMSGRNIYVYIW